MAGNKIRITLDFTEEQLETTKTFFNYNDWDFEESKVSDTKNRHQETVKCLHRQRIRNRDRRRLVNHRMIDHHLSFTSIRICQKRNVPIVFVCHA